MIPNKKIYSNVLSVQCILLLINVNIGDNTALLPIVLGISYLHLIVVLCTFFTFRTRNLFSVSITQGLFETFVLLAIFVSLLKFDFGGVKIVVIDFLILYYFFYSHKPGQVSLSFINKLFLVQVGYGIVSGILGQTENAYLPFLGGDSRFDWRISMFPNGQTPESGAFSLIVLILNLYLPSRRNKVIIGLSVLYLLFSGSRTAFLCLIFVFILLMTRRIFPTLSSAKQIAITYLLPTGLILFLFLSILSLAQGNVFVMELLFRNFADKEATFENFDRFLIMRSYWEQFVLNPVLGKSSALEFAEFADSGLQDVKTRGTETKLLKHLATYGISYFLFLIVMFREKIAAWKKKNKLITIVWVYFFISYVFYGSYMPGYSFIGFLMMLIVSNRIAHQEVTEEER